MYLQDNVVVIDGVAILGTNGWFGFDFDPNIDPTQSAQWYQDKFKVSGDTVKNIGRMATTDAMYMINSVKRLQTHQDVKKIVMVTHTVPDPVLISHDINLEGTWRFNTMGNQLIQFLCSCIILPTESRYRHSPPYTTILHQKMKQGCPRRNT